MLERQLREVGPVSAGKTGWRYNEVILNGDYWRSKLPGIIQAVWFTGSGKGKAHQVHADFLGAFGLDNLQVPLLQMELKQGQLDTVFRRP